jgi:hypothetical protein
MGDAKDDTCYAGGGDRGEVMTHLVQKSSAG